MVVPYTNFKKKNEVEPITKVATATVEVFMVKIKGVAIRKQDKGEVEKGGHEGCAYEDRGKIEGSSESSDGKS